MRGAKRLVKNVMSTLGFMFCFISRAAGIKTPFFLASLFLLACTCLAAAAPAPAFTTKTRIEQSVPYLTLKWDLPAENEPDETILFELETAGTDRFSDATVHYRGPDRASFIAGLAEGDYHFRVRSFREGGEASPWSDPVYLTIQYDSLAKAFLLFGIGAVVSIATVALVVTGDRRTRREEAGVQ